MQEISTDGTLPYYKAVSALVVYRVDGEPYSESGYFVSTHDVKNGALMSGRPLKKETARRLAELLLPSLKTPPEFLPPEVLCYSPLDKLGRIMWWAPAGVRTLYFTKETGIKSGKAPVPPMVFMVEGTRLHVWALRENKRPTPESVFCYAPFFNINFTGSVCFGDSARPSGISVRDIPKWEGFFFGSAFTTESAPVLKGIKPHALWNSLIEGKVREFPLERLKECGRLTEILGRRLT